MAEHSDVKGEHLLENGQHRAGDRVTASEGDGRTASARPAGGRRTFQFHMKLVESGDGARRIEGYASTRDLDRTGEIVEPGAFADSLTEFMANPVLTYMHDWSNPIGKVVEARIDEVGLFIRAEISETAEKVWKLIREGILRAFSIGYEVVEEKVVGGINHILRLRLYEVAVVSIPANRRALFSVSKGLSMGNDLVEEAAGKDAKIAMGTDPAEAPGTDTILSRGARDFAPLNDIGISMNSVNGVSPLRAAVNGVSPLRRGRDTAEAPGTDTILRIQKDVDSVNGVSPLRLGTDTILSRGARDFAPLNDIGISMNSVNGVSPLALAEAHAVLTEVMEMLE